MTTRITSRIAAAVGIVWALAVLPAQASVLEAQALLAHADLLFQLGPIQHVRVRGAQFHLKQLAACPRVSGLRTLSLHGNSREHDDAQTLATSLGWGAAVAGTVSVGRADPPLQRWLQVALGVNA